MERKTSVEVYLDFKRHEPDWDFSLSTITDKLDISPTNTIKVGEWATPKRQYGITQWQYSTGAIETIDFASVIMKIYDAFKDKVDIINELKKELGVETSFCAVTHVVDGLSPGYSIPVKVMRFAVSIDTVFQIDEYVYGFTEDDLDD